MGYKEHTAALLARNILAREADGTQCRVSPMRVKRLCSQRQRRSFDGENGSLNGPGVFAVILKRLDRTTTWLKVMLL